MKSERLLIVVGILFVGFVFSLGVFAGCSTIPSIPDRAKYDSDESWALAMCLQMNAKNPDKAACAGVVKAWEDYVLEKRTRDRLEYAEKVSVKGWSSSEVRLYLDKK